VRTVGARRLGPGVIRLAYFGLPLGALLLSHDGFEPIVAVLSPVVAPGARRLCRRLGDRVIDARKLAPFDLDRAVATELGSLEIDLIVSWYWTRKIPRAWLERARMGAIGAHPSLLPRHRGPDPFFWAIDSGDAVTGVSVHLLTEGYDEGAVIHSEELEIGGRNAWQLARALDRPSLRLLRQSVREFASGTSPNPAPQDEALATWVPAPTGNLIRADFREPSERVIRRIRALAPFPGLALEIHGVRFTVSEAEPAAEFPRALVPGEAAVAETGVVIRTGDGAIRITRATVDDGEDRALIVLGAGGLARALAAAKSRRAG